jgi:hypothetical protein
MKRLLLVSAAFAALLAPAAHADPSSCSLHGCIAYVCGSEDHCGPVQRCYWFTDYPTCIYP